MAQIRLIEKACPDVDFKKEIFVGDKVYALSKVNPKFIGTIVSVKDHKIMVRKENSEIIFLYTKNLIYFNDIIQHY